MDANAALLEWFEPRRSAYPWRRDPPKPYEVLVSEVMLQQTQAPRVVPAFDHFLRRFPTVEALAAASLGEVLEAWGGLGYNRRARALWQSAGLICRDHGCRIPSEPGVLATLPGVGPYTAAAVASLAFGVRVPALDTNVRRVVARFTAGAEPHDLAPRDVARAAAEWLDGADPGAWNQALMDLGRVVCRPKPRCPSCPLAEACRFRAAGVAPSPAPRRQGPFEGSVRQARGAVLVSLRAGRGTSLSALTVRSGLPAERVLQAVRALAAEGMVEAGPAAIAGSPRGKLRLPR
jgi:A/G-specific adenine glycosylase